MLVCPVPLPAGPNRISPACREDLGSAIQRGITQKINGRITGQTVVRETTPNEAAQSVLTAQAGTRYRAQILVYSSPGPSTYHSG